MFQISSAQKKTYLLNRISDVHLINSKNINEQFEFAIKMGHMLKGNGKTFGFDEVGIIGKKLEEVGNDKDAVTLKCLVDSLLAYLQLELSKVE